MLYYRHNKESNMKEGKNHVGRPTNEEVRKRKINQVLKVLIPVVLIILVVLVGRVNNNKIKGATSTEGKITACKSGYVIINNNKCHKIANKAKSGYKKCNNQKKCKYFEIKASNAASTCESGYYVSNGKCIKSTTKVYQSSSDKCTLALQTGKNLLKAKVNCTKGAKAYQLVLKKSNGGTIGNRNFKNPKNGKSQSVQFNSLNLSKYYVKLVYKASNKKHSITKSAKITKGKQIAFLGLTDNKMCKIAPTALSQGKIKYAIRCGSKAKLIKAYLYDHNAKKLGNKIYNYKKDKNSKYGLTSTNRTYKNKAVNANKTYHIRYYWIIKDNKTGLTFIVKSTSTFTKESIKNKTNNFTEFNDDLEDDEVDYECSSTENGDECYGMDAAEEECDKDCEQYFEEYEEDNDEYYDDNENDEEEYEEYIEE